MIALQFEAPDAHVLALKNLCKTPFAKTNDGYRFAYWAYDLNNTEENQAELAMSQGGEEAVVLFEKAKAELEEVVVTEDDYLGWTVHKKDAGGIAQYHKIIDNLSINLLILNIKHNMRMVDTVSPTPADGLYDVKRSQDQNNVRQILNRNNQFADVTIKSQQFFYKTADGGTETLFFDTNNIVDKVDKNGRNMLTMRPGFSVTKEHGVVQRPILKVTFANSMTEPIVDDEDHIYIHID